VNSGDGAIVEFIKITVAKQSPQLCNVGKIFQYPVQIAKDIGHKKVQYFLIACFSTDLVFLLIVPLQALANLSNIPMAINRYRRHRQCMHYRSHCHIVGEGCITGINDAGEVGAYFLFVIGRYKPHP
jgi:hypothetical protein